VFSPKEGGNVSKRRSLFYYLYTSTVIQSFEFKDGPDMVTADFVYVRWLGDRRGIEAALMCNTVLSVNKAHS
jgi:hypothetical protein